MAESIAALRDLERSAQHKRVKLGELATRRSKRAKLLRVSAGALALISAGSMTVVIADIMPGKEATQIFSAAVAFLSGMITLFSSTYFDEKETQNISEGASKFLSIRMQAELEAKRPGATEKEAFKSLELLRDKYLQYSSTYDHFIGVTTHRHGTSYASAPPEV